MATERNSIAPSAQTQPISDMPDAALECDDDLLVNLVNANAELGLACVEMLAYRTENAELRKRIAELEQPKGTAHG